MQFLFSNPPVEEADQWKAQHPNNRDYPLGVWFAGLSPISVSTGYRPVFSARRLNMSKDWRVTSG